LILEHTVSEDVLEVRGQASEVMCEHDARAALEKTVLDGLFEYPRNTVGDGVLVGTT
jgi:hypothetical protein